MATKTWKLGEVCKFNKNNYIMKKLLLGALLLLSTLSFSQTPRYLTENEIQFSIVLTQGQWCKIVQDDKSISYVYMLNLRNENFIPFMEEVNKVMTFYGFDYPDETYSTDYTAGEKYDDNRYIFSIYGDNNYRCNDNNHLSSDERIQLVYSYLTGDRIRYNIWNFGDGVKLKLSITKQLLLLKFDYPKPSPKFVKKKK